jgi:hypothetical protein
VTFSKKLEFGNYTLKFGEDKVLLDLFYEVVMPSFHEMMFIRKLRKKGDYFFLDTELIKLDSNPESPVLGVAGRIVKNTTLRREQIFRKGGGLIEDKGELETAPSSTFLLILNTHRLILCKEESGAPTIQNFQATSQYCLRQQHRKFLENEFQQRQEKSLEGKKTETITKKSLLQEYPFPALRITPLSDKESLKDFVARLKHIDKVSIKLLPTNEEEINNDDFWSDFGRRREEMNSNAAKVEFSNPKDGLNRDAVYEQAIAASELGNSEVKFKGHNEQGGTIRGSNEDFNLTVELEELPRNAKRAAGIKYDEFKSLVAKNTIRLPTLTENVAAKISSIFREL